MKLKIRAFFTALLVCLSCVCGTVISPVQLAEPLETFALSVDYPVQLMNLASKDNSKVLAENGTSDNSSLSMKALGNDLSPSWRFDRVGNDSNGTFFKLTNAQSGRLLTPKGYSVTAGNSVVVYGSESAKSQHWYVIPVKKDRLGNDLYYKIVNYSDTSLALTQGGNGISLTNFTGADNQLWLLNADGLQGFAGYCKDDNTGNIKAADIGGLFGELVEVSTFDDLKKYAESENPYTIVVNKNISVTSLKQDSQNHMYCPDGRIYVRSNKTIIGSYGNHTLYNVQFCTSTSKGVGNNIIIKNFDMQHDAKSNGNDSIVVYFGSGQNLWVDHVTFTGHSDYNTLGEATPDWDKFLACCYDADYCTVSDCYFGLHEYGLILGYPDDTEDSYKNKNNFPRMSIISSRFKDTLTRGPGLMRYGYFHSLNNYVYNFSMAYTVHSDCKLFAENCYYDGASTKGNVVCDWNEVSHPGAFADSGSKGVNCRRLGIEGSAKVCTWRPEKNYSYTSLSADQAKNYCSSYSGCQSSSGNMMYLRYGAKGIPNSGFTEAPSGPPAPVAESFPEGSVFSFRNVNSGLYMFTGSAENNSNVEQMMPADDAFHHVWKLIDAGDGYYCIATVLGDGGTYVLDVAGKKADNGTNICLYKYNGGINQQFMFTKNPDGSYKILTRVSDGKSAVEVADASKESGANIQQWEINGVNCQDWILEEAYDPGAIMDTTIMYEFENANSGMVMDIVEGKMESGTNVQQWGSNGFDCQRWILQTCPGWENYYYILSASDPKYALSVDGKENGGNISIKELDKNSDEMIFKFSKNIDGTYFIMTKASGYKCFVETAAASKESGANVQQWERTDSDCQKWIAQTFTTTTTTTTTATTTTTTTTTEITTTVTTDAVPPVPVKPDGDVNQDGQVLLNDAVLILQYLGNPDIYQLTEEGLAAADVSNPGDGITNKDALAIQRYILHLIPNLPEIS